MYSYFLQKCSPVQPSAVWRKLTGTSRRNYPSPCGHPWMLSQTQLTEILVWTMFLFTKWKVIYCTSAVLRRTWNSIMFECLETVRWLDYRCLINGVHIHPADIFVIQFHILWHVSQNEAMIQWIFFFLFTGTCTVSEWDLKAGNNTFVWCCESFRGFFFLSAATE